jgi:tetraacyldisaccharide 4'-kinase
MSLESLYKKMIRSSFRYFFYPFSGFTFCILKAKNYFQSSPDPINDICVISIGNVDFGGTGKTPFLLHMLEYFKELPIAVLSRGYKSQLEYQGSTKVNHLISSETLAKKIGDEPSLILKKFPSISLYVGKDRALGLKQALEEKAKWAFLDDGAQYPHIYKHFNIVLVDSQNPIQSLYPAGYRRDLLDPLKKADLVVIPYVDKEEDYLKTKQKLSSISQASCVGFKAKLDTKGARKKIALLTAIARPERLIAQLKNRGFELLFEKILDDHAPITNELIESFLAKGKAHQDLDYLCTEKDFVKISSSYQKQFLPIKLLFEPAFDILVWESFIGKIQKIS